MKLKKIEKEKNERMGKGPGSEVLRKVGKQETKARTRPAQEGSSTKNTRYSS